MQLTYCYNHKGFFSSFEFTEETEYYPTIKDAKKVFAHFKKHHNSAIKVFDTESYSFLFDSINDFDNNIVTVAYSKTLNNIEYSKMSVDKAKKLLYGLLNEE